ncbi:hypothetical protein GH714_042385 [Hevea brasiliensis]|uniref:BHLH domain-containing protein n=1 Tax=Hevea brasiliensis TaxID=3981 RepID=A0A6A6KNF1_HEVBR|nr:hypothetical protein GH714_042385 [Hevea brasiliensis]
MGTTALRQLLKSLCNNSIWNYAVLWKLRHESPMILNWEDGYFKTKPGEPVESITNDAYCKDGSDVFCPHFEPNTSSGSLEENLAGFLVADMSRIQYTLGEGVVGRVAFTRDHCWVSFNNIFTGEVQLIPECPEEWLLQFASGIKTILLVPALPHGVLQLGSLEEVAEDVNMVANVKGRFNSLHSIGKNTAPSSLKKEFQDEQSSPLISSGIDCLNAPSTTAFTSVKIKDLNHSIAVNSVEMDNSNQSTASRVLPLLNVENSFIPVGKNLLEALQYETENNIDVPSISLAEISTPSVSMNASQLEMMESKLFELSCLMEELQAHSDSNDDNVGMFGESFSGLMSSHPAGNIAGEPAGGKTANDMDNKVGGDTGYLLEAVVANVYSGSDDTSNRSSSFKSSTSISGHFAASPKPQNRSKASTLVKDDSTLCRHLKSACIIGDEIADSSSSTLRSMMDAIFSTEQHDNESDGTQPRKGHKTTVTKRRVKHGDNQRPRPRDRQLIQERVKELRELVPNSAKCSIDGLLDRTVRHMLYLKSVTDHAEKLRRCVRQEHPGIKNWRYYEAKENCQNGTSCAYEFGLEFQMCPILVEDLAYPGHMLILMLCDEQCLFLEIAQVIRGLELTILKGVLETRSDKTWARFVVEGVPQTRYLVASDAVSAAQKKPHLKQDLMSHLFSK